MALQREINQNQKIFTAYGEGYVAVNHERYTQAIVVTPEQVLTDWCAKDFATLTVADLDYLLPLRPEVLLLGTGAKQHFADPALYQNLITAGISVEFMDTRAACRTYNILVSEDRKVIAAVLI